MRSNVQTLKLVRVYLGYAVYVKSHGKLKAMPQYVDHVVKIAT